MPTMATPLRDPTAEFTPLLRERQTPPESLDGKTIALLDIGKARSREFLDRLEQQFHGQGLLTRRYAKPTNAKIAPLEVVQSIATEADVVISALSDWGSCTSCSLHDILELDRRGLPGAVIATEAFQSAAVAQSQALGFKPAMVYVPHPIQNRTAEELERLADEIADSVLEQLRSQPEI